MQRRTQAYVLGLALAAFTAVQAGAQTTGTTTDSSRMNGTGSSTSNPAASTSTANGYGTNLTTTPPCQPYRTGAQVGGTPSTVNTNPGGGTTVVNNNGSPSAMNPCRDTTGVVNGAATTNSYGTQITRTPSTTTSTSAGDVTTGTMSSSPSTSTSTSNSMGTSGSMSTSDPNSLSTGSMSSSSTTRHSRRHTGLRVRKDGTP